jgi:type II secretory pathway component PulL
MENIALVICVVAILWLLLVVGFIVYFWFRVMPIVRLMQKDRKGQQELVKIMFPPRFRP